MKYFVPLVAVVMWTMCVAHQCTAQITQASSRIAKIDGASFLPLYGIKNEPKPLEVKSFFIDRYPVTNREFLAFVRKHPEWRQGKVDPLLADTTYLKYWRMNGKEIRFPAGQEEDPVVTVSYFAASEYCMWKGGSLPKVLEWEYVAAASEKVRDASRDPAFVQQLLTWYAVPHAEGRLGKVGKSKPNYWGVYDLHGLIWEWTQDFNSVFVSGDNRREADQLKNLFCGAGSVNATDKANYAAFMRYALRSSLQGAYTMENLGFRCAYSAALKSK